MKTASRWTCTTDVEHETFRYWFAFDRDTGNVPAISDVKDRLEEDVTETSNAMALFAEGGVEQDDLFEIQENITLRLKFVANVTVQF